MLVNSEKSSKCQGQSHPGSSQNTRPEQARERLPPCGFFRQGGRALIDQPFGRHLRAKRNPQTLWRINFGGEFLCRRNNHAEISE
jgi:hypothetical protein